MSSSSKNNESLKAPITGTSAGQGSSTTASGYSAGNAAQANSSASTGRPVFTSKPPVVVTKSPIVGLTAAFIAAAATYYLYKSYVAPSPSVSPLPRDRTADPTEPVTQQAQELSRTVDVRGPKKYEKM